MESMSIVETRIGRTLYVVTSECSPNATETVEKKLERMICGQLIGSKSYPRSIETPLATGGVQSKHGTDSIVEE